MATYVIGDLHGCARTLRALLGSLPFLPHRDRLWLVGDLVNRGPANAAVLRWARDMEGLMGERFACVLGNHDLHLLARAAGVAEAKGKDTLDDILGAEDRDELLAWLRARPLARRFEDLGPDLPPDLLLVHAGLPPAWSAADALGHARAAEDALAGPDGDALLAAWRRAPTAWSDDLDRDRRLAFTLSALTLLRTVEADGSARTDYSGPPDDAPPGCTPWFEVEGRASAPTTVVFGHWAALGLRLHDARDGSGGGVRALDTGCVWGHRLTAVRLEDGQVFQQRALDPGPEGEPGTG